MAFVIVPILVVLGYVGWPGWWLWAFMAGLWGFGHSPVRDPPESLSRKRIIVGLSAIVVFVLTFAPVPFSFHEQQDAEKTTVLTRPAPARLDAPIPRHRSRLESILNLAHLERIALAVPGGRGSRA